MLSRANNCNLIARTSNSNATAHWYIYSVSWRVTLLYSYTSLIGLVFNSSSQMAAKCSSYHTTGLPNYAKSSPFPLFIVFVKPTSKLNTKSSHCWPDARYHHVIYVFLPTYPADLKLQTTWVSSPRCIDQYADWRGNKFNLSTTKPPLIATQLSIKGLDEQVMELPLSTLGNRTSNQINAVNISLHHGINSSQLSVLSDS